MPENNTSNYIRKEWMHPEDMNLEKPSNMVLYLKHLKAYEFALPLTDKKKVLEIGCGSGYGNQLLSTKAKHIYSVDIDSESLEFAQTHNKSDNVEYIEADVTKGVPLETNACDICVCYQVIEHIMPGKDMQLFLDEISRIVKPNGIVLFTTPNRKIRLLPFQKPFNQYHTTEYSGKSLENLLVNFFKGVKVHGLQALPDLKKIEIKRSKVPAFWYYIIRPIKNILVQLGIKKKATSVSTISQPIDKALMDQFTTESFWFDEKVPNDSIDLLAYCINQ